MYVKKNFTFKGVMNFSGGHIIWLAVWATIVPLFIEYLHGKDIYSFEVPWLPVSLVGTAVAFYVGFKNNSSYDRLWEARKIWGAIVNSSRMWGASVRGFVSNQFRDEEASEEMITGIHKRLVYRHIAWLYSLRSQLLIPTSWEHINQGRMVRRKTKSSFKTYGIGLYGDDVTAFELPRCLPKEEVDRLINSQNTATQIIDQQSQDLKEFRSQNLIDDFRHMELQGILNDFYRHQGKAERIKKFPLPRQYGSMSLVFVGLFIFLLPFGMVSVFHDLTEWGAWLSIPFSIIIGWVFLMMELIGDYSENPFEGLGNDIPMLALCRTIEIDLLERVGEKDLPEPIKPVNGVLM